MYTRLAVAAALALTLTGCPPATVPDYVCKSTTCYCGQITWDSKGTHTPKERPVKDASGGWYCKSGTNIYTYGG